MKVLVMLAAMALCATSVTALNAVFSFHLGTDCVKKNGGGEEVGRKWIMPDHSSMKGDRCIKPDDDSLSLSSVKLINDSVEGQEDIGAYCVVTFGDGECSPDDNLTSSHEFTGEDAAAGYFNLLGVVKSAQVVAGSCPW